MKLLNEICECWQIFNLYSTLCLCQFNRVNLIYFFHLSVAVWSVCRYSYCWFVLAHHAVQIWKQRDNCVQNYKRGILTHYCMFQAMAREHKGKLALDCLLIMPVQRIPRYELLIQVWIICWIDTNWSMEFSTVKDVTFLSVLKLMICWLTFVVIQERSALFVKYRIVAWNLVWCLKNWLHPRHVLTTDNLEVSLNIIWSSEKQNSCIYF
jgi:hypothetical protein